MVIAERFHFHKRDQREHEKISDYCTTLKKASERCEFKAFLDEASRDRFVCGLKSRNIQKKLLAEQDLTWNKALEIAQEMESAEQQASNYGGIGMQAVNTLKLRPRGLGKQRNVQKKEPGKPCFRCGAQHSPQTCKFKNEQCHNCKGIAHISKVCKKPKTGDKQCDEKPRNSSFRYLNDSLNYDNELGELFKVGDNESEPSVIVPVKTNAVDLNMKLDTGASLSVISEQQLKDKFPKVKLENSNVRLRAYTGKELTIVGQAIVKVYYGDQECELPIQIIK